VTGRRVDGWGRIDRSSPVPFTFDGGAFEGRAGDTLASALLANGVDVIAPSPIHGRPRGVFSAGVEEPNAFVELSAPWFEPIVPATTVELVLGMSAHGRPGVGRLPLDPPPTRPADHRHVHAETLVVGGGAAGLAAALEAARRGDRVVVAHDRPWWGGPLPDGDADEAAETLRGTADVTMLPSTTALGVYDDGYVVLHERTIAWDRIWHVRAARVVLATGAVERPIAFADGDRPGVMLAGAVRVYLERFGVLAGERAVVFTTNHWAYATARSLRDAGAEVVAIVDVAVGGRAADAARDDGFDVLNGWAVSRVDGDRRVEAAVLVGPDGDERRVDADLVALSGGWHPNAHLYRAIGGGLRYADAIAGWVPDGDAPPWLEVVGTATGDGLPTSVPYPYTPAEDLSRHYVDLQRDQTVADVLASVETGLRSVEHVKRRTYIGTAIDQGRTSAALTAAIVSDALGESFGAQGPTNVRPPAVPVAYSALAGRDREALLDPARTTPIHPWHLTNGAVFENVGQWKRPWYFPRAGEDMEAAVLRECRAVREAAGVLDASTLGKIEVVGADAATFLDRMYTNRMSTLPVGRIRYGLMLGLDGMVFDDGVAMRLADDRFLVTTTTGGAANVLDRFEEWLQTEWPDLRVWCTSVTEQWATVAVGGPRARDVVSAAGCNVDLSADAFPFMSWRDGSVAGVPVRVARVSFTGELSYELHVDGRHGALAWEAVMDAGAPFGLTPYGTEAMHVLRAEKGYVIVGQDTDGTVTPDDLGMSWIVRKDGSDFVGRRSLARSDTLRADRKHLVGLLPADPEVLLPEGTQLVDSTVGAGGDAPAPVPMLGHVTSSYRSAALGRTFALAMLGAGRSLIGGSVRAALPDRNVPCEVVRPVFWDPEDRRRDG
jgi:sarcosine oxidase subunit alpha